MTAAIPSHDDITTITANPKASADELICPICSAPFHRIRRQRYCSGNCRKIAWARTHKTVPRPVEPVPPPGQRKAATIYECPSCQSRYHGQQWCDPCAKPCYRIGYGGSCPHCFEPVAISDIIDTT